MHNVLNSAASLGYEEEGPEYLRWYLRWAAQRARDGAIDTDGYAAAYRQWDATQARPMATLKWEQIGPFNLASPYLQYFGAGPLSGRVNVAAYHPTNQNILFIGLATGGLWRSGDKGKTWTLLSKGWANQSISSIAIDPVLPNRIYVGTGDTHGGMAKSNGIMRSVDSGATWSTFLSDEMRYVGVNSVVVLPQARNVLLAAGVDQFGTGSAMYRSTNWGSSWEATESSFIHHGIVVGAPPVSGPRRVYSLVRQGSIFGVFSSETNGADWNGPSIALPLVAGNVGFAIAASPKDPNAVYVVSGQDRKIYYVDFTNPSAVVYYDLSNGFVNGGFGQDANYNWSQSFYNYHATVGVRGGEDELYVGQIGLCWTSNGTSWFSIDGPSWSENSLNHNDQHCMAINPKNSNEALVGNDGGIFLMTWSGGRGGTSFQSLNANLPTAMFTKAAFHPSNPTVMLGGTQDNATPVSTGNLRSWKNVGGGDGGGCAINPLDPLHQWATAQDGTIYRTVNNWAGYTAVNVPFLANETKPFITPIKLDPVTPAILYTGGEYVYKYNSVTGAWTSRLGNRRIGINGTISDIEVAPSNNKVLYVAAPKRVDVSFDSGTTWKTLGAVTASWDTVNDLAVSPSDANFVLAAVNDKSAGPTLRVCKDASAATATWSNAAGSGTTGLPVGVGKNCVTLDPYSPTTTWYVGTDVGVFKSTNSGASWSNLSKLYGMPASQVNAIEVVKNTGYLNVATFGQGMWRLPMGQLPTSLVSVTVSPAVIKVGASTTGTVTVGAPAPATGFGITLSTTASWATVPSYVIIPAGKTSATFTIKTTKGAGVTYPASVNVVADWGTLRKLRALTVNP
jgi:hypothetical protein